MKKPPKMGGRSARGKKKRRNNAREVVIDHVKWQEVYEDDQPSEWVSSIKEHLASDPGDFNEYYSGKSWTIHRVPANLLGIHKKSFVPKIISIGPFHYGQKGLEFMEEHKKRYLLRLLAGRLCDEYHHEVEEKTASLKRKNCISLEKLEQEIRDLEQETRMSYSQGFDISSEKFVQMMIVDGCFVVELLRLYGKFDSQEDIADPIFTTRWMLRTLQRDLMMLENQLPFFVLEKIFKLTALPDEKASLLELVLIFFDPLLPRESLTLQPRGKNITIPNEQKSEEDEREDNDHLLDVFRSTFLYSFKGRSAPLKWNKTDRNIPIIEERNLIHSASELQEANVRFKRKENQDLLDIKFINGVLEIPTLNIDDNSVPLFLNFLAYEKCDLDAKPFFTNYFVFLDSLINSQKDVEMLHQNRIINHVLGSDKDVANIFHTVCREIVNDLDECYLSKVMTDVNDFCAAYYASTWYVWWMTLKREYFSSPWPFISLLAAIFLLILTTLQTYYTMYPPKPI